MTQSLNSDIKATGALEIIEYDRDGNIIAIHNKKNLVVDVGKGFILSRMVGTSQAVMSYMALGTSPATSTAAMSGLQNEITPSSSNRAAITSSTVSGTTLTYTALFAAGVATSSTIYEAGIFNANSGGTMLCRSTFPVLSKSAGASYAISWTITLS